jgi:nucleotide-binding universal stress UspA family protein
MIIEGFHVAKIKQYKHMKNILIALDYGPTAQKVAEIGFSLGENMDASITLLHVIANPAYYASTLYDPMMGFGGYMNLDLLQPDIIDELKATSLDFLERSKHHLNDDSIKTMVKEGGIGASILEAATEIHADIIVMGSHSHRWLENIIMGSITEHVLHHTAIPLFIIPVKKHS